MKIHSIGLVIYLQLLSGPAGTVELTVFGGADHDPVLVGDLAPGEYRAVTLGELRAWAAASHPPPMARG